VKDTTYKHYLLAVLLVIYAFNNTDRLVLGLVLQNIKNDLLLSDTQLGLLTGIAFSFFYALVGVPLSRWADRGDRVVLIAATTALWSVAVALSGMAHSFTQLLLIRILAAVGEAACLPAAFSMIADYFSRAERPRALAIYYQGGTLSVLIGYLLGGWLNQFYGWRITLILLGVPGVCLALTAMLTLKEMRRSTRVSEAAGAIPESQLASGSTPPSLREVLITLWRQKTFRNLALFYAITAFFNTGVLQWQPAFFLRTYGLQTGELGSWIAGIYGAGTLVGTYLGGEWASRRAGRNEPRQLKVMAIANACAGSVAAFTYLSANWHWAFLWMLLWCMVGTIAIGPVFATIQTLAPARMRATAISLIYLLANLIGMGLGPLAAGALSDALQKWFAADSLRVALLALCPGYVWAGWYLWKASKTVSGDLARVAVHE